MRKLFITIIAIVLCLGLQGCGQQEKPQYDEATNQHVSIYGISFQVPKEWKKEVENNEYLQYAKRGENGDLEECLAVILNQKLNLGERIAEIKYGLGITPKRGSGIENFNESRVTIVNMSAAKIDYVHKYEGRKDKVVIMLIQTKKGVIEIMFSSPNKASQDDFDKVVESITVE